MPHVALLVKLLVKLLVNLFSLKCNLLQYKHLQKEPPCLNRENRRGGRGWGWGGKSGAGAQCPANHGIEQGVRFGGLGRGPVYVLPHQRG